MASDNIYATHVNTVMVFFYWADAIYYGNGEGDHPVRCDRDTEVLNVTHWMPLPKPPNQ